MKRKVFYHSNEKLYENKIKTNDKLPKISM